MNKKSAAARSSEAALKKTLAIFGGACVVEILLLIVNRFYADIGTFLTTYYVLRALRYAALAGVGLGAVLAVVWRKTRGAGQALGLAVGGALAFFALVFIDWMYPYGAQYLCVAVPILALLGLIYYIYQREFFVCAAMEAAAPAGLWVIRRSATPLQSAKVLAAVAITALLIAAAVAFSLYLRTRGGCLILKKDPVVIFPARTDYRLIPVSGVIGLVALAAGLVAGSAVVFYAMICLAAYLFVLAVYFTVKLM